MKLGFATAILPETPFEEIVDFAAEQGFKCLEVMCWPKGKAERRYAGITHIDVDALDNKKATEINTLLKNKGLEISALSYYPNPLDSDLDKRKMVISHLEKVISGAKLLGVATVNTFIGRDLKKSVDENLAVFKQVWPEIIEFAENQDIKLAIENCPMLFTNDEWPGGKNLATSPRIWETMFDVIPSENFGLNYDPSHLVWQQMDYIKPIHEFTNKLFHIHIKDIKVYAEKLDRVGILAPPLDYCAPKIPGLGDVDWGNFVSALMDVGYDGYVVIEVEDKAFENSVDMRKQAVIQSKAYINQFLL